MPAHGKLWGDGFPTQPALMYTRGGEELLKVHPKIVCFDLIAHLLHTLVIKGLVKQQVCLCNHSKDVWQVIH